MKIKSIERLESTSDEDFTLITFKPFMKEEFTKKCMTPNWNINTYFCDSGEDIPIKFWNIVKAFLRTNLKEDTY